MIYPNFEKETANLKVGDIVLIRYQEYSKHGDEYIDFVGEISESFVYKSLHILNPKVKKRYPRSSTIKLHTYTNSKGRTVVNVHHTCFVSIVRNYDRVLKLKRIQERIKKV